MPDIFDEIAQTKTDIFDSIGGDIFDRIAPEAETPRKPQMGVTRSFAPTLGERAMDIGKQVFEAPKSLGEAGLMLATGIPAWIGGSLTDIAITGVGEALGKDWSETGEKAAEEWSRAVWQPETPTGQKMGEVVGKGIEVLTAPAKEFAYMAGASWDSPTMEKVVRFVAELAIFKKMGEGVKGVKAKVPEWYNRMPKKDRDIVDNMVKEVIEPPVKSPVPREKPPMAVIPEKPIPEVKPAEKVAPEPIVEGGEPLIQEALKYKSAEEFISTFKKAYHGSDKALREFDIGRPAKYTGLGFLNETSLSRGYLYFSDKKTFAKEFGTVVNEAFISKDAKIFNPGKASEKKLIDIFGEHGATQRGETGGIYNQVIDIVENPETAPIIRNKLKDRGYDGIYVDEGEQGVSVIRSTALLNPDKVKTKSQLIDIWNKAHEKVKPVEKIPEKLVERIEAEQATFTIKAAKLPEIKTVDDLITAFKEEKIEGEYGETFVNLTEKGKASIADWNETIKSIKQTKDTVVVTLKSGGKQKFIVPEVREVVGAKFLGYAKGKKGTGFKIGDEVRKKLKQLARVDTEFAKNPTFTVREKGGVLEANYIENGKPRNYKFFSEGVSPRIRESFFQGMIKEGDTIRLSEGYLENKSPAIYLVEKGKEPKGITLSFMGTQGLYESSVKAMKGISTATSQMVENAKLKPEIRGGIKEGKVAMIEHDRNIRRAEFTSKQLEKVVRDVVPKEDRQMLMTHAYEHKLQGKHWKQLSEIEKGVVRWAALEKTKLNKYIKDNDVLEMMETEGLNHIFHHWIDPKTKKPFTPVYGKFSKGLPQAKQRTIPTYEVGIEKKMVPATTNLGKLIGLEWEAATRANSARQLFKELHGIKGDPEMSIILRKGKPPQPIRMVERWDQLSKQGLTDSYIRYDSPFLDKTMSFQSSDGTIVRMKGAVGVQKELHPFVRAYVEDPNYGTFSQLNFVTKSLKLGVSMFHVVSLGMQELANLRIPFVHIPKGLRLGKELSSEIKLLHQEGLELFKGYEDLGYRNRFFEGVTLAGKAGNVLTYPITKVRDFIFNIVQPGMKTSFADMQFRKMLPRYLKEAGEKITAEEVMLKYEQGKPIPESALKCARDVVLKSDGHFSGEHYKRSLLETNRFMVKLYFSPEARVKWQAALLSPTWQREHLLVAKNVAKSFMPDPLIKKLGLAEMGPIKSQYRRYALGGIMIIGAVDLWNQMSTQIMDGESKHIWENPKGKGFAVRAWWDEPDYTIITKNGQKRRIKGGSAYIRPLKSLFEVAEWAHDPFRKFSYKLSPMVTAVGEQMWGRHGYGGYESIPERTWDFVTNVSTPIVVDQALLVVEGKKAIPGAVTAFFGMPATKVRKTGRGRQVKLLD